jgi:hypothetical protein
MDYTHVRKMTGLAKQRPDPRLVTIECNGEVRMLSAGDICTLHNTGRRIVTAHGVKRQSYDFGVGTH